MLSFTRGRPIAAICGGANNGKILRITEEEDEPDRKLDDEDLFELLDSSDFYENPGRKKPFSTRNQVKIKKSIERGTEPLDDELVEAYHRNREKVNEKLKKELTLSCGTMFIIPDPNTERVYIAGKSGSGKTCLAVMYANEYKRMFPDRRVILISRHEDEKAYETVDHEIVPLEAFGKDEDAIDLTQLQNALVIFDDMDLIQDPGVSKKVRKLTDDIISGGRKYDIHAIWLNHQLMDYSRTRNLLNEANKVVFFNSGSNYHIQQYLKRYAGLSPEQIRKILSIKSRWTMLGVNMPIYVLHEHGAFIL